MRVRGRLAPRALLAALSLVALVALAPARSLSARGGEPRLAPSFRLRGVGGEKLALEELRKKGPVLLDFWATWCKPCVASIPELQGLHREFSSRGLTVIGISLDGPRNYPKVRPFARKVGITYPIALDEDGTLQEKFQVRAMPTTVLIDSSGRVVEVLQGYRPGEVAALKARIQALLGTPASADSAATEDEKPAEGGAEGGNQEP